MGFIFSSGKYMFYQCGRTSVATTTRIGDKSFIPATDMKSLKTFDGGYRIGSLKTFTSEVVKANNAIRQLMKDKGKKGTSVETARKKSYVSIAFKGWDSLCCDLNTAYHFVRLSRLFHQDTYIMDLGKNHIGFKNDKIIASMRLQKSLPTNGKCVATIHPENVDENPTRGDQYEVTIII